jgi:hypothetical protein|tara:strand:- start:427 stop:666 length:240 start_codon:yes stop_codon:yes gene_type:complete
MSDIINFPFEEKEGKYFAPIVSEQTTYKVVNGAVVVDSKKLVAGIKGVFAKVRLNLPINKAINKTELFAVNSEAVNSSN